MRRTFRLACALLCTLTAFAFPVLATASEYHGQITFRGWPVPGATVTVIDGTNAVSTVSDQGGLFTFADLPDGSAKIKIEMQCFRTIEADLTITPHSPAGKWELTLLPLDQIINIARSKLAPNSPTPVTSPVVAKSPAAADSSNGTAPEIPKPQEDASQEPADGFLVNGSVNNAATSRFSLDQAFGNKRFNSKSLYSGGLAVFLDNSALDARPYSLSGLEPDVYKRQLIRHPFSRNSLGPIPFVRFRTADSMSAQSVAFRSMTLLSKSAL